MNTVLQNASSFTSWASTQVEKSISTAYKGLKDNVLPKVKAATQLATLKAKSAWETATKPTNLQTTDESNPVEQPSKSKENRGLYQKTVKTINKDVIRHTRASDVVLTASGLVSGVALVALLGVEAVPMGIMLGLTITGIAVACIFHRYNVYRDKKLYDYLENLKDPVRTENYVEALKKWEPIQTGWTINRKEDDRHVSALKDIYSTINKVMQAQIKITKGSEAIITKIENLQKTLSQFSDKERKLKTKDLVSQPSIQNHSLNQPEDVKQVEGEDEDILAESSEISEDQDNNQGPLIEELDDISEISFEPDHSDLSIHVEKKQ